MQKFLQFAAAPPVQKQGVVSQSASLHSASISRKITLIFTACAAVLICSLHAATAGADTEHSAGISYLCVTLVLSLCTFAFWTRSRTAQVSLQVRWSLLAIAALTASIGYVPSFAEFILHTPPARQLQIVCFNASEALYLLSAVLFFAKVSRSVVVLDMMQALLFVVLRYQLVYSSSTSDHFQSNHLLVGQIMALCLFIVAVIGCLGASSRPEQMFLRTLSCFFGLRLIDFFLSNQVSYTWLSHQNSSLWEVPGTALFAGFAFYLLFTARTAEAEEKQVAPLHAPTVMVRSLMPSFLALVNLMLGLMMLSSSLLFSALAISTTIVFYIVRTALFQVQTAGEKAQLETRNEHLEGLAVCDPLTGIGNRRSLSQIYEQLHSTAGSRSLSLILIDIDYFKQANDCFGHLHGDKVLVSLSNRLAKISAANPESHCARFGGDEFSILLPDVSPQHALAVAEELRREFGSHTFDTICSGMSLSIGVASLRAAQDLPLEAMISYTDQALYRSKLLGRNRVEAQPVWESGSAVKSTQAVDSRTGLAAPSPLAAIPAAVVNA